MKRQPKRRTAKDGRRAEDRSEPASRWTGLLLFGLALVLRLLFWQATADAAWPHSAYYKGDALTWTAQAKALRDDVPFELDLPLRPPGAAWLVALVWNGRGSGISAVKLFWCLLGAATVFLVHGAARRSFGDRVALVTGLLTAWSTGLMVLSTSLNNETPYLFLVAAAFRLWPSLQRGPTTTGLLAWGGLQALACLARVEHALVFVLTTAWLAVGLAAPTGPRQAFRRLAVAATAFVAVLVPWHVRAWTAIHRFNTEEPAMDPATEAAQEQVEQAVAGLEETPGALAERRRLPAFCRRTTYNFIRATVAYRGRGRVEAGDFAVLEEAFGYRPEPLDSFPFVAIYGGLNFFLAQNAAAEVGFSRAALDRPPHLEGGPRRYPRWLIDGLPPPDLAFVYPPHVEAVNRGYRLGFAWIRRHPGEALSRAAARLVPLWDGATFGFGGDNLPFGLAGLRRRADLVVPDAGSGLRAWQLGWLAVAAAGLFAGLSAAERRDALVPWLALLCTKIVVSMVFFGYARHGATAVPVVALLGALAGERFLPRGSLRTWTRIAAAIALLAVAVETVRWTRGPVLSLDGRRIGVADPWPGPIHENRRLRVQ